MKIPVILMVLTTITVLTIAGYPNASTSVAIDEDSLEVFQARSIYAPPSCIDPHSGDIQKCDEIERQILASTVRLVFHRWVENEDGRTYTFVDGTTAHATLKAGGYLVTHNHLNIMRTKKKDGERVTVSAFQASGKIILSGAAVDVIQIIAEDPETLVLDLDGEVDARLSTSPAEFKAWESLPLRQGMEVAQVNWDGAVTFVDWVAIEDVIDDRGTPRLELANVVGRGASGGGVFWNGHHIANTWAQVTVFDKNNLSVSRQYNVAALNSAHLLELSDPDEVH